MLQLQEKVPLSYKKVCFCLFSMTYELARLLPLPVQVSLALEIRV
jgi:hypothetical protein